MASRVPRWGVGMEELRNDPQGPRLGIFPGMCDRGAAGCGGPVADRCGSGADGGEVGRTHRVNDRFAYGLQQRLDRGPEGQAAGVRARDQACQRRRGRVRLVRDSRVRRHHGGSGEGGRGGAATRRGRARACHRRPQRQRQRAGGGRAGDRPGRHPHRQLLGHLAGADRRRRQRFPVSNRAFRRFPGTRPRPPRASGASAMSACFISTTPGGDVLPAPSERPGTVP